MNNTIEFTEIDMEKGWIFDHAILPITLSPPFRLSSKNDDMNISNKRAIVMRYNDISIGLLSYNLDENGNIHNVEYREDLNFKYNENQKK